MRGYRDRQGTGRGQAGGRQWAGSGQAGGRLGAGRGHAGGRHGQAMVMQVAGSEHAVVRLVAR